MTDDLSDFDVTFDFLTEVAPNSRQDADSVSPTLRRWHRGLWSKPARSGRSLEIGAPGRRSDGYLIHRIGEEDALWLGSDAITNSYTGWLSPKALVAAMSDLTPAERDRYLGPAYTIASAMIWPVRSANRPTINQARGTRSKIGDRMDLTLECIRRHYAGGMESPLSDVLGAYGDFFEIFDGFEDFVDFFHFGDLVEGGRVKFFFGDGDFSQSGLPQNRDEYIQCREATLEFIDARGRRMVDWVSRRR